MEGYAGCAGKRDEVIAGRGRVGTREPPHPNALLERDTISLVRSFLFPGHAMESGVRCRRPRQQSPWLEVGVWTGRAGGPREEERERREKWIGRMGGARSCCGNSRGPVGGHVSLLSPPSRLRWRPGLALSRLSV